MKRLVYLCTLPVALLLAAGCSKAPAGHATADASPVTPTAIAPAAWNPTFTAVDGSELKLAGDPAVKAIALILVLPDCPICNAYLPELNRVHSSFAARGVSLILVHVDPDVTADAAREHAREYQIQLPVVLDPHHAWVKKAGATTAPEAAIFSPAGEILYRGRIDNQYAGLGKRRAVVTSHDLQDALEAVLAGQPVREPRTEAIGCPIPAPSRGD